jgi:hypothetical protein
MSSTVSIYKGRRQAAYIVYSSHHFFATEAVIVDVYEDRAVFSLPTLDHTGKTYTPIRKRTVGHQFGVTNELIRPGVFDIDDESTEDRIIIYFQEQEQADD